jgi:hypothetical protein
VLLLLPLNLRRKLLLLLLSRRRVLLLLPLCRRRVLLCLMEEVDLIRVLFLNLMKVADLGVGVPR